MRKSSSVAVLLCASVVSVVAFILFLFVPHFSILWCLERAVLCDYGIFCISSFIYLALFVPHLFFFWCIGRAVLREFGLSWVTLFMLCT